MQPNGWRYPSRSTPAQRPAKGDEGWWVGLGTIPVVSRDETTPLCRNQLQVTNSARKRARCEAAVPPPHLHWRAVPVWSRCSSEGRVHAVLARCWVGIYLQQTERNQLRAEIPFVQTQS